jgi:hypothetical protein
VTISWEKKSLELQEIQALFKFSMANMGSVQRASAKYEIQEGVCPIVWFVVWTYKATYEHISHSTYANVY